MKLLQINSVINFGSTGRIAEEIGQLAITLGWESYIAYGRNDRASQSKKIRIGTEWDLKIHGLKTRLFDRHGFGSTKATKKLIIEIEKLKPEIIHLHNIHGYYINIELLFNYLSQTTIPIVWTFHDCWPITGHCVYFDFVGCKKWKEHCDKCPQKNTYPSSVFRDNSFYNYDIKKKLFNSVSSLTLVPVSDWLADIIKESFFRKYPVEVIHNGVDTSIFRSSNVDKVKNKYDLANKFVILGVASVWDSRKGLNDFLELNTRLMSNEVIILIGLTLKQKKSLPNNIIGIERTENISELVEFYSTADVFVNPTWEDNFPTTNIEALACGTPVITYNTGGSPEAISKETGFSITKGSLNELREKLDTIKMNGKSHYKEACRKRAMDNFNKNERYQEYIDLYQSLVKR